MEINRGLRGDVGVQNSMIPALRVKWICCSVETLCYRSNQFALMAARSIKAWQYTIARLRRLLETVCFQIFCLKQTLQAIL